MSSVDKLFTELFRAKKLHNLALPKRVVNELSSGLKTNTLLYGPAGTGKTSISRILASGYETLELNGSLDNGIDVVRDRIDNFASTLTIIDNGKSIKVVFIDECDGFSDNAWKSLRHLIEKYSDSTRFICTCNLIDKIPEYIKSRFNCIAAYPVNKDEERDVFEGYVNITSKILDWEKITYTDESVRNLVGRYFPDMRSILNTLQSLQIQGVENLDTATLSKSFDCNDLFDLIIDGSDPNYNYTFVMSNYSNKIDEAMCEISKGFAGYIMEKRPDLSMFLPAVVITIADYMDMMSRAIDRSIVLMACVYRLQGILKKK